MQSLFYLGTIKFLLSLPPVSAKTEKVLKKFSIPMEKTMSDVSIVFHEVEQLPEIDGKLVYTNNIIQIYSDEAVEWRQYFRLYSDEYQPYAVSKMTSNQIEVWYLKNKVHWGHSICPVWNVMHLENVLLSQDALILHSVYYRHNNDGILFTAPSGTGKTTHAHLWNELGRGRIINGDKTMIQKIEGKWHACGYPFHGSAPECENVTTPLKYIVIIRQAKENQVVKLSPLEQIKYLYSEITVNQWNIKAVERVWELLEDLIYSVPVVLLECTKEKEAAELMYDYIYGEQK